MFPYWFEQYKKVPIRCSELILTGSLGGGKTYFASYYLAYRIYVLLQAGSPQIQLGTSPNTDIYILYFSVNMSVAQKSGFLYLRSIFETCRWFQDNAPVNPNLKSSIDFLGKRLHIDFASGESHQIGLNVAMFILDEANFRSGVGTGVDSEYAEVQQLYEQLLDRQLSRYACPDGSVNALAILVSSASYQSSFTEKRKAAIKNNKHALCITSRSYETKPHKFSKETFRVFIGCGSLQPCIIIDDDHANRCLGNAGVLGTGQEKDFILSVPINLRPQFETNIVLALQNHCGVPTALSSSFMNNMKFLYDSYVDESVIPPILQSFELEASTADDTQLIEYLIPAFIQYSGRPHSIFLDLSLAHDLCGLVCYRYDGKKNGLDMHTRVFSLHIMPPAFPNQTKVSKVQQFIIDLAQHINIVAFASDQYQSAELRQEVCDALGLENVRISIDSTDQPHLLWMRALTEGRIIQTRDVELESEIQNAVHDWKRHRVIKSKESLRDDILQANVGAFFLSDTVGKLNASISDLYGCDNINLTSSKAFKSWMAKAGYVSN